MALQADILASQITSQMPIEMQIIDQNAIPTAFQGELGQAVAKGFTMSIKNEAKGEGPPDLPEAGKGIGITSVTYTNMVNYAMQKLNALNGRQGIASQAFFNGVFKPTIPYLLTATVESVNGYGGPITKITNLVDTLTAQHIFDSFTPERQQTINQSISGRILIECIAYGFCTEILANGKAEIPSGGTGAGSPVAAFS